MRGAVELSEKRALKDKKSFLSFFVRVWLVEAAMARCLHLLNRAKEEKC